MVAAAAVFFGFATRARIAAPNSGVSSAAVFSKKAVVTGFKTTGNVYFAIFVNACARS